MYGHFGEGCIHSRISFDLRTAVGVRDYRAFMEEAADLVTSYGGTLSGEHGDGQQRAELLERQYGPTLVQATREFKLIWDPDWKMNPGKVVDPYRLDRNLRLGTNYNPPRPEVEFAYSDDGGDFAHAALRCVGVGKCRVPDATQTMCPSYRVTREEKHSTRGRARLLFEMLQGEVVTDGWQSKEVAEALDLCLACKGCTNDCPVNVDIPTYKAEFLHHHYRSLRRWRPRYAYAFGFIDQAARLATRAPELVNLATQTIGVRRLVKLAGGIDRKRRLPRFAPQSLQRWYAERGGTRNPHWPAAALFKDELRGMLPHDDDAARLEQNSYHFAEFFETFDVKVPRLDGEALLWGHCHHRATGGIDPEQKLLERMGVSAEPLSGGCCGLAGSWGFEKGKYDISMQCGEEALLPAVRDADPRKLVVANGFSCKTQIAQARTGRKALHIAEVIALARARGRKGADTKRPETGPG
ncbi:4Fe-4S dicluster domain-containing protein [Actinopolymorpha singaporensis]|uniref:4Fe-4S dicluster domain-containing protein n=2 Tax=Actinopolymorpha singaporensis TaxID=117157 RepID=A0A1H1TL45_9ACTN|nr:4Fe-4S dicluster domain-containing protein [Actinopolymorpha singaporensis]